MCLVQLQMILICIIIIIRSPVKFYPEMDYSQGYDFKFRRTPCHSPV